MRTYAPFISFLHIHMFVCMYHIYICSYSKCTVVVIIVVLAAIFIVIPK